jgi:hypothetical protein
MTATAETTYPAGSVGFLRKELMMEKSSEKCLDHIHVIKSGERQEAILEAFRNENAAFKEKISAMMAEICTQLKAIGEIKSTQVDNMRRREDFTRTCEEKRTELWEEITKIKEDQSEKKGMWIGISFICGLLGASSSWIVAWFQKH